MKSFILVLFLLALAPARAGTVLDEVRQRGRLACGVVTALDDETVDDTHGDLSAFGADICRAVGAAVLGPRAPVDVHAYAAEAQAYAGLRKGEIVLLVGATPNAGLARSEAVDFLTPVYFDTQGLLVRKGSGIHALRDLAGKRICFIDGTDAQARLADAVARAGVRVGVFPFQEIGEMEAALADGHCDAVTHDASKLAQGRALFHGRSEDFEILPEILAVDPLSPVVRTGDAAWARAIDWVTGALVQAEISGVTQANVEAMRKSADLVVQTVAGGRQGPHWGLYLDPLWSYWAIKAVGNYGEVFERDAGAHAPLHLDRGLNKPWTDGGLLWSPPFR